MYDLDSSTVFISRYQMHKCTALNFKKALKVNELILQRPFNGFPQLGDLQLLAPNNEPHKNFFDPFSIICLNSR